VNALTRGLRARLILASVSALAVAAIAVTTAGANSVTGTATLSAGSLAIISPATLTFSGPLTVAATYFSDTLAADQLKVENPGGATGWNVTAWNTPFTCTTSATCHTTTLTDLVFNGATSTSPTDTGHAPTSSCTIVGCTPPTPTGISFPVISTQSASDPGSGYAKVYNADTATGVGAITVANAWWIDAPVNTQPGTYSSTITLAINATP
jgi:hypothetical protein